MTCSSCSGAAASTTGPLLRARAWGQTRLSRRGARRRSRSRVAQSPDCTAESTARTRGLVGGAHPEHQLVADVARVEVGEPADRVAEVGLIALQVVIERGG